MIRKRQTLFCAVLVATSVLIGSAEPASAAPVVALLGAIGSAISSFVASSALAGFLVRTAISIGLSLLSRALQKKPRQPGIQTDTTTSGGRTPQKFILGRYATAGQLIAPPNSYMAFDGMPRAWLVYPIALSVVPGCTVERIVINDEYATFVPTGLPEWPLGGTGGYDGKVLFSYFDGTQTAVHPGLMSAFASDPDRPWLADMVGPGLCYAVIRFFYARSLFNGLPSVRFEMMGIPLYDPRADGAVGGSGAQSWDNPATWVQSENPAVMIYNILRGIDVGTGIRWGGDCEADDLPLSNWFAAMNACDVAIPLADGGSEPQYRAGLEIALSDEPAAVIEELLKACAGQIVEVGGRWKMRVGAPSLPTYFFSDDDLIVSKDQEFEPFPGLSETFNGITSTYPEPESLWEAKEAPPRYNDTWEAEDGDRRLVASLDLPACTRINQVQRLMAAYIADHRRFRRHRIALPAEAAVLEPLETVAWTSARFGYSAKVFEVASVVDAAMTLIQGMSLRERDGTDFAWSPSDMIATSIAPVGTTPPVSQAVPGFAVEGVSLLDAASTPRRPGLVMTWTPGAATDVRGLKWQIRVLGASGLSLSGAHSEFDDGELRISDGVLPLTTYQVRARLIVDRATSWTAWTNVTTPAALIGSSDIEGLDLIAANGLFRVSALLPSGSALSRIGMKATESGSEDDSRAPAFWLEAVAENKSRMVIAPDMLALWTGSAATFPFALSAGQVVVQGVKIGGDVIVDQAVSRQFIAVKAAGSLNISPTTEAAATEILPAFSVELAASKGDNPVVVTLSGRVVVTSAAPACLNFVLEFEYTAGSGIWASVGTGQPFHVINASTGVNAHHLTYISVISHTDLHLFQRLRLRGWVTAASPFNSRAVTVDAMTAQINQVNR